MILSASESLNKLNSFFTNELSSLDIPELIRMDTNTGYNLWNQLILNNSNLTTISLENLEQSPYILLGENLTSIDLTKLQQVEFNEIYLNSNITTLPTRILQNTKIQTLNLPNFVGTAYPLPQGNDNIESSNAQYASFWNNYWLKDVSLGNDKMNQAANSSYKFNGFWFRNNYFLKYLRLNYPYVIPLVRIAGFNRTPIGSGEQGHIYVPDNLVDSYKAADNWTSLKNKIKPLSSYEADIQADADSITDSWEQILTNCAQGTIGNYHVGDTKTVMINNVPCQFRIVGINQDKLSSDTTKTASLSWLETTISRFNVYNVADVFDSTNPRQYANATNFRSLITNIYNGFDPILKNGFIPEEENGDESKRVPGIKSVIKYSKGFNNNNTYNDYSSTELVWAPGSVELGLRDPHGGMNLLPYTYYETNTYQKINYRLGATANNDNTNGKLCVALRDFANETSNYPDLLRATDDSNQPMEIVMSNSTQPYLIVGFCT